MIIIKDPKILLCLNAQEVKTREAELLWLQLKLSCLSLLFWVARTRVMWTNIVRLPPPHSTSPGPVFTMPARAWWLLTTSCATWMKCCLMQFYGSDPTESRSYSRMVNLELFNRTKDILWRSSKVAVGGQVIEAEKYIGKHHLYYILYTINCQMLLIFVLVLIVLMFLSSHKLVSL